MLYKNNIGPQVRRKRYALGWSQSISPRSSKVLAWTSAGAPSRKSKPGSASLTTKTSCFLPRC